MKPKLWIILLFAVCTASACRATLEFSGYYQVGNESKFTITDVEGKTSSGWISIGASFEGYRAVSFDAEKEVLTMRKGATDIQLPLKMPHAKNAGKERPAATLPPEIARRGITSEDLVLRQDEKARINLGLSWETIPAKKRYVSVDVRIGREHFSRAFNGTQPAKLTREMLPETAQAALSNADIENINRHLSTVLPKWLPEDEPNQSSQPSPRRG